MLGEMDGWMDEGGRERWRGKEKCEFGSVRAAV